MRNLTIKQRRFVDYFFTSNSASEAARRAGYQTGAGVRACTLLKLPHIQFALDEQRELLRARSAISTGLIARGLLDAYEGAHTVKEEIMAARELGRLMGFYPKD